MPSFPPILLHLGPEEGEKLSAFRELRAALRKVHGEELEEHSYYAFDTPPDKVVDLLQNGSLFGSGVLVRYRAVENLKRREEIAPLLRYAANPVSTAVLVMESSETSVQGDLKKAAGAQNTRIFWEMFENQKQGWLSGYFRRHEVQIEPEGIELFLELVENNTLDLRQEADRLIGFVGKRITLEDVDQYIYHAREESIFTLYDAVVAQDLEHALDITEKLVVTSEPVQILLGLSWQLERLYTLQILRSGGIPEARLFDELAQRSGQRVAGKRLQKSLLLAARRYALEECAAIRILTSDTDALLRTVPVSFHRGILQQYLYSIIIRKGSWSVAATPGRKRPWEYPGRVPFRGV